MIDEIMHEYEYEIACIECNHSWAVELLKLPLEQQDYATEIINGWIDDEVENLYPVSNYVSTIVKGVWIYLLENEAISIWCEKEPFIGQAVPYLTTSWQAVEYFVGDRYPDISDEEKMQADIFLQLMFDGYMKPDMDKLIQGSKLYHTGNIFDVSLRNKNEDFTKINNIDRLKAVNKDFKKNIENIEDIIQEFESLASSYRDIYEITISNLAMSKCYSDEEILELRRSKFLDIDEDTINAQKEIRCKISSSKDKEGVLYEALRFCKDNNLILPFEEKIIVGGTLEEKRLLALQCVIRMKLYR